MDKDEGPKNVALEKNQPKENSLKCIFTGKTTQGTTDNDKESVLHEDDRETNESAEEKSTPKENSLKNILKGMNPKANNEKKVESGAKVESTKQTQHDKARNSDKGVLWRGKEKSNERPSSPSTRTRMISLTDSVKEKCGLAIPVLLPSSTSSTSTASSSKSQPESKEHQERNKSETDQKKAQDADSNGKTAA